jgi:hypothetical protein
MGEIGSRLSKLAPLLGAVSAAVRRKSLPALVESGEIILYVRVPAGKTVYRDAGIQRRAATINEALGAARQTLSGVELAQVRDAEQAGRPLIRYPVVIPDAAYVGLAAKDARRLLDLDRIDVHWFPCAVLISPQPETDAKPLLRVVPGGSPCCLRPDDGRPKRGPWIGHDMEHALAIALDDVFVDEHALRDPAGSVEDPLELRDTAPGVYVLYSVAARFNDPKKGMTLTVKDVQKAVKSEVAVCNIAGWLFNGEVLQQARKLINTHHSETQGGAKIANFKLDVLGEKEGDLHSKQRRWISDRMALLIYAARYWQDLVQKSGRVWASMNPDEKLGLARQLGYSLKVWGFTTVGEWRAVFLVVAYPDDLRSVKEAVLSELKIRA